MKPTSLTRYWLKRKECVCFSCFFLCLCPFCTSKYCYQNEICFLCAPVSYVGKLVAWITGFWTDSSIFQRWALLIHHISLSVGLSLGKKDKDGNVLKLEHKPHLPFCLESFHIKEMLRTNINVFFFKILLSLPHNPILPINYSFISFSWDKKEIFQLTSKEAKIILRPRVLFSTATLDKKLLMLHYFLQLPCLFWNLISNWTFKKR